MPLDLCLTYALLSPDRTQRVDVLFGADQGSGKSTAMNAAASVWVVLIVSFQVGMAHSLGIRQRWFFRGGGLPIMLGMTQRNVGMLR